MLYDLLAAVLQVRPVQAARILGESYPGMHMDVAVPYVVSSSSSPDLSKTVVPTPGASTYVSFDTEQPVC